MTLSRTIVTTALVVGCAGGGVQEADDSGARRKLDKLVATHDELRKKLDSASPKIKDQCDFQSHNCVILAREKLNRMARSRYFPQCSQEEDLDRRGACQEGKLLERGEPEDMTEYLTFKNWCIAELLKCASELQVEHAKAAKDTLSKQRKLSVEMSPPATALYAEVDLAREKATYLDSTLPANAERTCQALPATAQCRKQVEKRTKEFEAELAKDEGAYQQKAAARLFEQIKKTEASCFKPEIDCLLGKMGEYGAAPETREVLDLNLDLIEQREKLRIKVDPGTAEGCLQEGISRYQDGVDEAHRKYSRRPTIYFRMQLHRASKRLHRTQVKCLEQAASSK